jgi:sec-independent protein translocase protein TatB
MFDVGFSELILIALVALIVIGPERLPKVARTVGHLLGRLQRYVNDVKSDINREMQLDELKKLQEQVAAQAHDMERQVNDQMHSVETSLNASIAQGIEDKAEPAAAPVTDAPATVPPAPTSAAAAPAVTDKPAA